MRWGLEDRLGWRCEVEGNFDEEGSGLLDGWLGKRVVEG